MKRNQLKWNIMKEYLLKWNKKAAAGFVICAFVLTLSACSGKQQGASQSGNKPAAGAAATEAAQTITAQEIPAGEPAKAAAADKEDVELVPVEEEPEKVIPPLGEDEGDPEEAIEEDPKEEEENMKVEEEPVPVTDEQYPPLGEDEGDPDGAE